jgi:flotillin
MGYRSDLEAAHARQDALEQRIGELEAENARLRRDDEPDDTQPDAGAAFRRSLLLTTAFVVVALCGGAALSYSSGFPILAIALVVTATMVLCMYAVLASLIEIVPPGFVLVISGRQHRGHDGRVRGYRVVSQGRVVRMPIVERAERLDCRLRTIPIEVSGAYSHGNHSMSIALSARVRLASTSPGVENAIERFLGRSNRDIEEVARQTLEGNLRSLVATLTPEEMDQDREKFTYALIAESETDLHELGFELDGITIDRVTVE